MKPSQLISDICSRLACEREWSGPLQGGQDWCAAVEGYLDGEAERRAAFEAGVLERLAKLERKTSSTEDVEMVEELDLGPDLANPIKTIGGGIHYLSVKQGRTMRVRWREPESEATTKPTDTNE